MHVSALLTDTQRWMELATFACTESGVQQTAITFLQRPMTDAQAGFEARGGVSHGILSKRSRGNNVTKVYGLSSSPSLQVEELTR